MIKTIFYFVDLEATYLEQQNQGNISNRTIAFCADTHSIWKNGELYGTVDETKIKGLITDILNNDSTPLPVATTENLGAVIIGDMLNVDDDGTISVDVTSILNDPNAQNRIKEIINTYYSQTPSDLPKATHSQLGAVVVGNTLDVNDGTINYNLPTATLNTIGGIKVGEGLKMVDGALEVDNSKVVTDVPIASYSQFGTVRVDQNGGITVNDGVIAVDQSKISGEKGEKGDKGDKGDTGDIQYTELAFKATSSTTPPSLPNVRFPNGNDGWKRYAENNDGTKYVWMSTRVINQLGTTIYDWVGPWLISGPGGTNGEDGKGIEFVYIRTNVDHVSNDQIRYLNAESGEDVFQEDDYVPQQGSWTDNPQGVTEEIPYEFAAVRTSNSEGVWSEFSLPFLWSHYGQNGMDGDGVEYIYYASLGNTIPVGQWPNEWAASQEDEYTGPTGSLWTDDPQDLETLGQGARLWVSVRKKREDENNPGVKVWGQFSTPTLWSYISQDGIVDGYTVDFTNETMPVPVTSSSGYISSYNNTCGVQVYHNGTSESNFDIDIDGTKVTRSDGVTVNVFKSVIKNGNTITSSAAPSQLTTNIIQITVNDDIKSITINMSKMLNFSGINLFIPVTVSLPNDTTKDVVITLFGVAAGKDGESIDLYTSASVIRTDYYSSVVVPNQLEIGVKVNDNKYSVSQALGSGYSFEYYYDTDTTNVTQISTNSISLRKNASNITINMKLNNLLIDSETIPYIKDGAPGIGVSNYQINVLSNTILVDDNGYSGEVQFNVIKDNQYIMENDQWSDGSSLDGMYITIQSNGLDYNDPGYYNQKRTISVNSGAQPSSNFTAIYLHSASTTIVASVVVPYIIKGATGSASSQPLAGTIIRFYQWTAISAQTEDQNRRIYAGSVADKDNDGMIYLDIIESNGNWYRLIPASVNPRGYLTVAQITNNLLEYGFPSGDSNSNDYWIKYNNGWDTAFTSFITKYGFIKNLTSRELVITDGNNSPVAGLTSSSIIAGDGDAIKNVTRGDVRIWAGTPTNNNLSNCPFYVTNTGYLHATNAAIEGTLLTGDRSTGKYVEIIDDSQSGGAINVSAGKTSSNDDDIILTINDPHYTSYSSASTPSPRNGFAYDGSGWLANGNISWDVDGNLKLLSSSTLVRSYGMDSNVSMQADTVYSVYYTTTTSNLTITLPSVYSQEASLLLNGRIFTFVGGIGDTGAVKINTANLLNKILCGGSLLDSILLQRSATVQLMMINGYWIAVSANNVVTDSTQFV